MKTRLWRRLLVLGPLALLSCRSHLGTISGSVRDDNGPVAGAIVRVQTSELFTTTGSDGRFTLARLPADKPVTVTAWAPGYYIAGTEQAILPRTHSVQLELVPHTKTDNPDYDWLSAFAEGGDPGNCQNCHAQPGDPDSALPFDEWQLDAHSRSAQNVRFLTMYTGTDVAGNQSPDTRRGYSRNYGSFPLRPDPTRPYHGAGYKLDFPRTAGNCAACHTPVAAIEAPYDTDPTQVSGVGAEGVACDFCHKVWDVRLDDSGLPYPNMPGVLSFEFRRPPDDHQFFAGPYQDVAPGEDTYSPLQQESQFCAPCHFGTFWGTTIYNSFGEWLDSPYSDPQTGLTCQDCHMPTGLADHFARPEDGGLKRDPDTIFSHRMLGASDEEFLQGALSMSVDAWLEGAEIVVQVEIANDNTGHHIPTDSPLRHMILVIEASDSEGNRLAQLDGPTIPEWGGVGEPAAGYYAGLPGTAYAKVLQELWTGIYPTGAYWNPTRILSDNRIPAMETDTTTCRFSALKDGEVRLDIRLLLRRAFSELMEQKGWDTPDILMAQQELVLE